MFADNWKISLRQVKRLLILDIFGLSSLLLPGMLSSLTGADGVFCLLLGMAGGSLLLLGIGANLKQMKEDYYHYMAGTVGQFLADFFMVFYFLYFITLCGFVLYETATLALSWMLPDGSFWGVCVLLLLLAAYGTIRGIEGRARIYEILFWFLGVPLLVMLFLAMQKVDPDRWAPIVSSEGGGILQGSLSFGIFLLPLAGILFLKPFCKEGQKLASCARTALFSVTLLDGVIYLILLGVFGSNTMGILKRPAITLMGMLNLPGGFFTRQDVVMISVWFFALFALLHTGLFQSSLILKELFHEERGRWSLAAAVALAFAVAVALFHNQILAEAYGIYQKWIALPGIAMISLLLLMVHGIRFGKGSVGKKGGGK